VSPEAAPLAERKASAARVLGTFLTLALFLGALIWLGQGLLVRSVDGAAKQRELFGDAAPPFALALDSAARLPTGDTLVRFTRPEGASAGPSEVLFLEYRSRAAVEPLFRPAAMEGMEGRGMGPDGGIGARMKEWEKEKAFDWHCTIKRGEIAWGAWSSKLLIERSFKKGGGWSEEARVDLSSPQRALVLFAHWPPEKPVDEKALKELLLAVGLTPP
jgi:hypothetical protein